jgi:N6-adenosine-specific RNA methylase IME4
VKAKARALSPSFTHSRVVAKLEDRDQETFLEAARTEGWTSAELARNVRAAQRRHVIEGQAVLEGMYRVIYADPPWTYGNKPPSGSGAQTHYKGMTIEQLCDLPVEAHARPSSVLFCWVTAPMLYENPGPREVIEAWGFTPKTGIVWDKVDHVFGNYVSVRHEHLIIATRGKHVTPDRPTPMPDSVQTERQDGEHSSKPESFRAIIEKLYDGPYLELFGRERRAGWDVFGNDARLWAQEVSG